MCVYIQARVRDSCLSCICLRAVVVCSSYLSSHEGGFRQEGTMVEYFKSVVDLVNSFYAVDRCVRCVVQTPLKRVEVTLVCLCMSLCL